MKKHTSQAVKTVAETADKAVQVIDKLGVFVVDLFGPTFRESIGVIEDRISFIRWERKNRLIDRYYAILKGRQANGNRCAVPPKYAIAILENATLEEDDFLQDMWARLLVELGDPNKRNRIRVAFIEIIKQLESLDAVILQLCHEYALPRVDDGREIFDVPIPLDTIKDGIKRSSRSPSPHVSRSAIDNLLRLRCLRLHVLTEDIPTGYDSTFEEGEIWPSEWKEVSTAANEYVVFCMTPLGSDFVETCLGLRSLDNDSSLHARR